MDIAKIRDEADKEHRRALRAEKNREIGDNERQHLVAKHMQVWAMLMAKAEPDLAIRWSGEAAEWHKRACVALDAIANDKLDKIWAAVAQHRKDAAALMGLVAEANE